ncbi:MAG: transcriptional regulator [Candidatus Lokiarchaeota archaeon]
MREENTWKTRRQKLIEILKEEKEITNLKEIMGMLEYFSIKRLVKDIRSITKTLQGEGYTLLASPPQCSDCHYFFPKKNSKFRIPSKCPKCKSERILMPKLKIEKK